MSVTIAPVVPTVTLNGVGDGTLGGNIVFTATVAGPSGAVAPTGNMTWSISGTAAVTSCVGTPTATSVGNISTFICDVTEFRYGSYIASGIYAGDNNYTTANTTTVTLSVSNLTPSVSVLQSGSSNLGGSTTLTAQVVGPAASSTPATPTVNNSCRSEEH